MKKFAVVVLAVALLMLVNAPVFAAPPTRGTFLQGIVEVQVAPGKSFVTGDIVHSRGGTSASYVYGSPWGNSLSGEGTSITSQINTATLTGTEVAQVVDTFAAGVVVGTIHVEIMGPGLYTYNGPSFSFTLPGKSGAVTHGATYARLLFRGFGVKHGISGELKGLETMEKFAGLVVMAEGFVLVDNTVSYKLPG